MGRKYRITLLAGLVALAPVMAGCSDFDLDSLDVFHLNEKKKLPGERKELFPGGVPGVTQGIPPEYMKGNQQQQPEAAIPVAPGAPAPAAAAQPGAQPAPAAKTAAAEPAAEPAPKPKPKRKPKPAVKKNVTVQPVAQGQGTSQQQQLEPWPSTPAQPAARPAQANDPWLNAPPPPSTLSR